MRVNTILVSGCFVWDKITQREYPNGPIEKRNYTERVVSDEPGGTAGNVACLLAHYGWEAYPQAQFDLSRDGYKLKSGLKAWGCDVRFVENMPAGKITKYFEERKLNADGSPKKTVYSRGGWGSQFGAHKFLRAKDEVPEFLEKLDFVPNVYFFDVPEAGPAALGTALKERGSLVYYEPELYGNKENVKKKVMARIGACDIMKFSRQSLADTSFCDPYKDKLFIQTRDKEGVAFRLRGGNWITVPAVDNQNVVDTIGAGDFTTSAFLKALGDRDALSMDRLTEKIVREALEYAMEVAAKSVSYEGAKGMIWAEPGFKLGDGTLDPIPYKGKILYLHGSASCGNSHTPMMLANELTEYKIVAPDIPHDPIEAVQYLRDLCEKEKPDLVVGSSMGGYYAHLMFGWKRVCVNPALHMSTDVDFKVGKHQYRPAVDRVDGSKYYIFTQEMHDHAEELEARQMEGITEFDRDNCWGVFGTHDTEIKDYSRKEFCAQYRHWVEYEGEHRLKSRNVKEVVAPLIRKLIANK